jgi:hypothetical protein
MFDSYSVAINLALNNEVSKGLAAISGEFGLLNRSIAGTQGKLSEFQESMTRLRNIGSELTSIGAGGIHFFLNGPYEEAKRLMQAKADFENLNLSADDNAAAYAKAAANAHAVLGSNITDNIKQINDLHTAFGDLHHALQMSGDFAKFSIAAKIANGGHDVDGLVNESVKALEQRGGKVINDDATFRDELHRQSQVYFGTKGKVSGKDYFAASQTGGMSYALYDKEYLYGEFAAFMQAKSGSTAGTAGMTMFSSLIGGHMDNKAKGFLADLGLLQVGVSKAQVALVNNAVGSLAIPQKEKDKLAKSMMPVTGGLKDELLDVAAHRPDLLINDYLVPAIRKRYGMNLSDDEIGQLVAKNFNRGTSKAMGELIVNHLKFEKDANIFANAKDYTSAYNAYLKSPEGAEMAAAESWKNLSTMIGVTFIPKITEGLGMLAHGLDELSQWTEAHPTLTKDLTYGFIALGSAMAIGGTIATVTSALSGLGLALKVLSLGGEGGIAAAAAQGIGSTLSIAMRAIPGVIASMGSAFIVLSEAAMVGIAGAIGYAMGHVLSQAIDKGIQLLPGQKDQTLGTATYNLVHDHHDWFKGMTTATQAIPGVNSIMGIASYLGEPDDDTKAAPAMSKLPTNKAIATPPTDKTKPTADNSRIEQLLESINAALGKGMNLSFTNYLDGKEVLSHLVNPYGQGTTGINTGASLLSPGMSSYGLG